MNRITYDAPVTAEEQASYRQFLQQVDMMIYKQEQEAQARESAEVINLGRRRGDEAAKDHARLRLLQLCGSYIVTESHMEHIDLAPLFDEDIPQ